MVPLKLTVSQACLLLLLLCHEAFSYPRGRGGSSLALVKRPADGTGNTLGSLPSEDELEMALQQQQGGSDFDPEDMAFEWGVGRGFPNSARYFGMLERLVKKKDNNQDQPKRTGGNRKFQTQGWR